MRIMMRLSWRRRRRMNAASCFWEWLISWIWIGHLVSFYHFSIIYLNTFPNVFSSHKDLIEFLITTLFEHLSGQVLDTNNNTTLKPLKKPGSNKLPNLVVEYHLCEVIFRCETKYPREFDACLNSFLNSSTKKISQEQRNYFLNTISNRFSTFKCKSTFKYQQVKVANEMDDSENEFNLGNKLN